ncbi:N-formylglutamate amidohydrolase [Novosphingobium colocasiae]|uniref:N-formylglutamate amidohydrolase n=1 Tax=Novosphingobium colocasiae TaxID=1256513 RepID=A0A918UFX6_9SPHN|nr:N-formylglutamate amidohydrolase [Novosphingobium colocasiae]GGZ02062.1 N-formylglutamate amidohydrolase [Novosphingobium colocasiae]
MNGAGEGSDSGRVRGGHIPGSGGRPSFFQSGTSPSAIPVLLSVPHAGRDYPRAVLRAMRNPRATLLKLEDRYVDLVAQGMARSTGAGLIAAMAPRAMIDLNRSTEDVDWEMFSRAGRPPLAGHVPSHRARSGLGLIPRRLPGIGEVWRHRHEMTELDARVDGIHAPYHAAVGAALEDLRGRWGAALLLDVHSMPPLSPRAGQGAPAIVIGDRFGATCHGEVIAATFAHFAQCGLEAAHNRPYAGGYVLERHARPQRRIYALQIEIDRSRYLDGELSEPGRGFEGIVSALSGLVRKLACCVAELGQSGVRTDGEGPAWPLAAE